MPTISFASNSITAKITDYGIYTIIKKGRKLADADSTAGYSRRGAKVEPSIRAHDIPLKKGITFGFRWEATGFLWGVPTKMYHRIKHPPTQKPDGRITTGFEEPFTAMPRNGKVKGGYGYRLTEKWELLPGKWSIELIFDEKILAKQTFTIIDNKINE